MAAPVSWTVRSSESGYEWVVFSLKYPSCLAMGVRYPIEECAWSSLNQCAHERVASLAWAPVAPFEVDRKLASEVRDVPSSRSGVRTLARCVERPGVKTLFGYGTWWNCASTSSRWSLSVVVRLRIGNRH